MMLPYPDLPNMPYLPVTDNIEPQYRAFMFALNDAIQRCHTNIKELNASIDIILYNEIDYLKKSVYAILAEHHCIDISEEEFLKLIDGGSS